MTESVKKCLTMIFLSLKAGDKLNFNFWHELLQAHLRVVNHGGFVDK